VSVETRQLAPGQKPPDDEDHVLIVDEGSGWARVTGSVQMDAKEAKFWNPPAYPTWNEAFEAAEDWANANGVPVIYTQRKP
jgi:hypothetical protein